MLTAADCTFWNLTIVWKTSITEADEIFFGIRRPTLLEIGSLSVGVEEKSHNVSTSKFALEIN